MWLMLSSILPLRLVRFSALSLALLISLASVESHVHAGLLDSSEEVAVAVAADLFAVVEAAPD